MNAESRIVLPRTAAIVAAVTLLVTGSGATYLLLRMNAPSSSEGGPGRETKVAAPTSAPSSSTTEAATDGRGEPIPDVTIQLTADAVKRAGIVVSRASAATAASTLRFPGVVAPNAYRQVVVTPLVSGRVTSVIVQLGDRVRKGQPIAQVYSPELAEARTRYVSAVAMLEAHDRELQRTQKLVEIGAASRQELERIHAEHAAQTAAVDSARAQLELLGVTALSLEKGGAQKLTATTLIPAPIDGVITERSANVGLNVDPATRLFTVVDLSTVWVLAGVHERDIGRVRVGTEARITSDAFSGCKLDGRVSYIDPQLDAATRTTKARIELQNPSGELRLGIYVDVVVATAATSFTPTMPRSAVQNIGDRTVVYLADGNAPGTFVEREVRLGESAGDDVEVVAGIHAGDLIVTTGSFSLRAERERLGLRTSKAVTTETAKTQRTQPAAGTASQPETQTQKISVTEQGYEPATITVKAGRPIKLTFVRTSDKVCGTEVVFPSMNLKHSLPLKQPIDVEFTPSQSGEITFVCDMKMLRGTLVVQ
jgi:cobalt-zinc-cadmium efflux system membrane fusion protein